MGVRRGAKREFSPPPRKLGLRTKIFWKTCSEHLIQINWLPACNDSLFADISGVGRRGCKRTSKSFDVVKIWAKFLKIGKIRRNLWKPWKTPENLGKLPENVAKMASNVLWFEKIGHKRVQNHMKTFFYSKNGHHEKIFAQMWSKIFSGTFEEIRAKILRAPKHLSAITPMADITGTLHKRQVYSCGVM